jgi:hypothetical protein
MKRYRFLVLLSCLVATSIWSFAQTNQGTISGVVTDSTGAVVTKALVTVLNAETGVSRVLQTNEAGEYVARSLTPGVYQVTVEATGFKKFERRGIRLEVATTLGLDFKLTPGAVTEVLTVTGEQPLVETLSNTLGGTFSNVAITELPLQGRDFQNLAILQPGIQRIPGGGFQSITANGNRPEDNNFIIDGIDDNDAYYGTTVINAEGVEGTPATHLPIDAIQEFNIQSGPEADYGWKPGAIINVGIKSGTNAFHGSTYYFNRNSATDARNWFNPTPAPVSALNLHQFGVDAGGPIIKDKLFIFGNYEGVRNKVGNPLSVDSPLTVTAPGGPDPSSSLLDAVAECTAAGTCSQMSLNLIPLFPLNPGPSTLVNLDFNNLNREDNAILKADYHLSQQHAFVATYFFGDSLQTEEDTNVLNTKFLSQAKTRAQVLGTSWIWTPNARVTNQLRFGFNNFWQQVLTADHNTNASDFGIDTGVTDPLNFGLPVVRISGFNRLGGSNSWPLYTTPNRTLQFFDTVSYVIGTHNLRFGGEFRTGSTDNLRNTYGKGEIRFNSHGGLSALENFTQGFVQQATVFVGDSHRDVSQKSFGAFVQDSWRAAKRLTINAGLRYDLSLPITEAHDLLANFDPAIGLVQVGKQISKPYNTDYNNFAPRLGFAWDFSGKGTTVIRAAAGVIYEIPHISVFIGQNGTEANGLAVIPTGVPGVTPSGGTIVATTNILGRSDATVNYQAGGPVFGDLSPSALSCSPDNPCPILGTVKNLVTPYVINWNLNLEQALWRDGALTLAYVGNKGNKLYSLRDINQNVYANDFNGDEQSGRPYNAQYPFLSYIDQLGNGDASIYHGLQVTLKQRTSHGLYFVAGYTWAHTIDDSSGNRTFDIQNSYDPAAERGNGANDVRHRFTLATTYEPPSRNGFGQMLKGWRLNNIFSAQTGRPLFVYDSFYDISGTGEFNDHWNLTGDPADFRWTKSLPAIPFIDPSLFTYDSFGHVNGGGDTRCLSAAKNQDELDQLGNYGCFAEGHSAITPPAAGTFGNMRRNALYGPAYFDWDFSLLKTFTFGERVKLEARAEIFNILNHPNFAGVDHDLSDSFLTFAGDPNNSTFGVANYTPDVAASNPVVGSGGSRHFQFGVKVIW